VCMEVVGHVISIDDAAAVALVHTASGTRRVSLALLRLEGGDAAAGDWVLSHTGIVVARIGEDDARRIADEQAEMRARPT
jgi:hydrogenase assembly chaperone HypC/HupF